MKLSFPLLQLKRGQQIFWALILVFVSTVALDQVTKRHAHSTLLRYEDPQNVEYFTSSFYQVGSIGSPVAAAGEKPFFVNLKFQYQRNRGAAFSMLANLPDHIRVPFFYAVTLFSVIYILYYLRTLPINFHLTRFGLVMIMAGAIGNFIDRVIQGYVIDFVDVSWNLFGWRHDFAVFNVADIAINIGIIAFLLEMILRRKPVYATFQTVPPGS
jgi:signal peptidase II